MTKLTVALRERA
jgi:hypothetical protein